MSQHMWVFRVLNKGPCTAQADDLNYRKESKDKIALPVLYIRRSLGVPHLSFTATGRSAQPGSLPVPRAE